MDGRHAVLEKNSDLRLKKVSVDCDTFKERTMKSMPLNNIVVGMNESRYYFDNIDVAESIHNFRRDCESTAKGLIACAIKIVISVLLICRVISSTHSNTLLCVLCYACMV